MHLRDLNYSIHNVIYSQEETFYWELLIHAYLRFDEH